MITSDLIIRDKEILGGKPVFAGTRVPVETMIDYLEGGHPLDEFLDDFPSVRREQACKARAWLAGQPLDHPSCS